MGERGVQKVRPSCGTLVTRPCISATKRHQLQQPFKGGKKPLQNLLMGPYICIHFTQSLFIFKNQSLSYRWQIAKSHENTAAPLPAVIAITRLLAAETCYARRTHRAEGCCTRTAGASLGTPSTGSQGQVVLSRSTVLEGHTG